MSTTSTAKALPNYVMEYKKGDAFPTISEWIGGEKIKEITLKLFPEDIHNQIRAMNIDPCDIGKPSNITKNVEKPQMVDDFFSALLSRSEIIPMNEFIDGLLNRTDFHREYKYGQSYVWTDYKNQTKENTCDTEENWRRHFGVAWSSFTRQIDVFFKLVRDKDIYPYDSIVYSTKEDLEDKTDFTLCINGINVWVDTKTKANEQTCVRNKNKDKGKDIIFWVLDPHSKYGKVEVNHIWLYTDDQIRDEMFKIYRDKISFPTTLTTYQHIKGLSAYTTNGNVREFYYNTGSTTRTAAVIPILEGFSSSFKVSGVHSSVFYNVNRNEICTVVTEEFKKWFESKFGNTAYKITEKLLDEYKESGNMTFTKKGYKKNDEEVIVHDDCLKLISQAA